MIQLRRIELPPGADGKLRSWQREIDDLADYAARISVAKERFARRNRPDNAVFRVVREFLGMMCCGVVRCVYCEDSMADEVEHIWPKDSYPEFVFVWANYVFACGPCNGRKNNHFAVFAVVTGQFTEVTRNPRALVTPPTPGQMVFIDPCGEDGLTMMDLDFETGELLPRGRKNSKRYQRAQYTIEILGLNKRGNLLRARRAAYRDYRALLGEYVKRRDEGASQPDLDDLISFLKGRQHPTVWAEMKRQRQLIDELKQLFAKAPEALGW